MGSRALKSATAIFRPTKRINFSIQHKNLLQYLGFGVDFIATIIKYNEIALLRLTLKHNNQIATKHQKPKIHNIWTCMVESERINKNFSFLYSNRKVLCWVSFQVKFLLLRCIPVCVKILRIVWIFFTNYSTLCYSSCKYFKKYPFNSLGW